MRLSIAGCAERMNINRVRLFARAPGDPCCFNFEVDVDRVSRGYRVRGVGALIVPLHGYTIYGGTFVRYGDILARV